MLTPAERILPVSISDATSASSSLYYSAKVRNVRMRVSPQFHRIVFYLNFNQQTDLTFFLKQVTIKVRKVLCCLIISPLVVRRTFYLVGNGHDRNLLMIRLLFLEELYPIGYIYII